MYKTDVLEEKKQASIIFQNQRTDAFIMLHHTVHSWITIRAKLKHKLTNALSQDACIFLTTRGPKTYIVYL